MLSRALATLALIGTAATAQAATSGLRMPERLTAGTADQFLGVLDPSGQRLFYVTNENSTTQLFGEDMTARVPSLLFDEASDVTWPRVSPDGHKLLYISYQTDATGELCTRELQPTGFGLSDRKCFPLDGRSALQAAWLPDSSGILLVSRSGLSGEIELQRLSGSSAEALLKRDLSSPAVSPDGKWLSYVPIARDTNAAGAGFAGRAGTALELVRLDQRDAKPLTLRFDLPGKTGFPAFSADGRFLYFSQYLNDTNFDGTIDGNDHSVLFRVPFDGMKSQPVEPAKAEQLTSANWDCQYPFPGRDRLIATCLFEGSLDIYSLPLDGAVPPSWNRAKLLDELSASRSPWEKLLLFSRLSTITTDPIEKALYLRRVIEHHLRLGEEESADFYTRQLEQLAAGRTEPQWREEEGLAQVLREIAGHRRAEEALSQGQLSAEFLADEHARLDRLQPLQASPLAPVAALATLAMSEIQDTIGNKAEALSLLNSVQFDANTRPIVLHLLADRAAELYGALGEKERLLELYVKLSAQPSLEESERLSYAEEFVTELLRGSAYKDRPALLEGWRSKLDPASDAAFVVDLERALVTLTRDQQEPVRARIFDLYRQNKSFDRRRTLVHDTLRRAASTDSEVLRYEFANTWVSFVDREQAERRRAEAIYRNVVLERAYVEWAQQHTSDARGHFYGVTLQAPSLESHVGFIEARFREGKTNVQAEYRQRFAGKPDDPQLRFALAYLIARGLPEVKDPAVHEQRVSEAIADLQVAARGAPNSLEINHLWGYLAHQRYLRTGHRLAALEANAHYLLALDLARDNPRYRAAILSALGLLQSRVGNHQLSLEFYQERQKLPFVDPLAQLSHCLGWARSLLHADRSKDAAERADQCVALVDRNALLAKYLPLALDRAALYHLVADDYAGAHTLYLRLQPLLDQAGAGPEELRNRFVAHVGRASAALGLSLPDETLSELAAADQLLGGHGIEPLRDVFDSARPVPGTLAPNESRQQYELLFTGLRAEALFQKGDLAGATAQMERRRDLLKQRLDRKMDDDRLQLALAESHLATYAYKRGAATEALAHVEAGLRWADEYSKKTGTEIHPVGLALLRAYAELHLDGKIPLASMTLDLPGRLTRTYALLCDRPNPDWAKMRAQYSVYLSELMLEGVDVRLE